MKKTIGKIALISLCIAVCIFLLLPFLETTAPQQAAANTKTATPQIFTTNPLTELVSRIARFFGATPANSASSPTQTLTAEQANEQFGDPQENAVYADARAASGRYLQSQETPVSGANQAYENAVYQNEDGEWVLIRQTVPESVAPGMHEINTKDNAYEIYAKQERNARFTPVASMTPPTKKKSHSRLARIFTPIKNFFGFNDPQPVASSGGGIGFQQDAAVLASSEGFGETDGHTIESFKRAGEIVAPTLPPLESLPPELAQQVRERNFAAVSYLNPEAMARSIAQQMADAKFPNPQTPEEQEAKENFFREVLEKNIQQFNEGLLAELERVAEGQEPKDEMAAMNKDACQAAPLPSIKISTCNAHGVDPSIDSEAQKVQVLRTQNQARFKEHTHLDLPELPLTVVLGKVGELGFDPEDMDEEEQEEFDPQYRLGQNQYRLGQKMYQFMMENTNCNGQNSCYWVANAVQQSDPELKNAVEGSGMKFNGDPLNRFETFRQQFLEHELEQKPNATEQEKEKIRQDIQNFSTPYLIYTQEEIRNMQNETLRTVAENPLSFQEGNWLYSALQQ